MKQVLFYPDRDLPEELLRHAERVREFAREKLLPHARLVDEERRFRLETVTELAAAGILGGPIAVDRGGAGWYSSVVLPGTRCILDRLSRTTETPPALLPHISPPKFRALPSATGLEWGGVGERIVWDWRPFIRTWKAERDKSNFRICT